MHNRALLSLCSDVLSPNLTLGSMAGSRSTAPLSRSNSVFIVFPLSAFQTGGYVAPLSVPPKRSTLLADAPSDESIRIRVWPLAGP